MRKEKLIEFKNHLKDFEKILKLTESPLDSLILWLGNLRPAELFEVIMDWINEEISPQEIQKRIQELYQLIDQELAK